MQENSELFIGLDVSKDSHAVAVAEAGRNGEVRYYGGIGADAASVRRLVRKLDRPNLGSSARLGRLYIMVRDFTGGRSLGTLGSAEACAGSGQ